LPPAYFRWLGVQAPPGEGDYFIDLTQYVKEHLHLEPNARFEGPIADQEKRAELPWTAKECPDLAAWLALNEKALAIVVEATKRPDYFNPIVAPNDNRGLFSNDFSLIHKHRELVAALRMRAFLYVSEGKSDEAWQDLLACHRLGRLVARGSLIEFLVGVAIDSVASYASLVFLDRAELTPRQIRDCLRALEELPPIPPLADKYDLNERFVILDLVRQINRKPDEVLKELCVFRDAPKLKREDLDGIDWDPVLHSVNRTFDRLTGACRVKDRAARAIRFDEIDAEIKALIPLNAPESGEENPRNRIGTDFNAMLGRDRSRSLVGMRMVQLFFYSAGQVAQSMQKSADRGEQTQRNQRVAFALAAYRRDHGRYPMKLDDLAPKYLAQVPDDLFSGKALIYWPSADGYLLYSVGVNGQDDGGRTHGDEPSGGDDIRVRMPRPEAKLNP